MSNSLTNEKKDNIVVENQENTALRVDEASILKADLSNSDIIGIGAAFNTIGKLLEPRLMKKKLEQFKNTLDLIKEYEEMGLITPDKSYSINGIEKKADLNSIDERAIRSLVLDEINKQANIDSIACKCLDYIDKDFILEEEIDDDWLYTFRDSVKNISSEELQAIWAKLLANEIQSPSSYSLRTLDTLKKMDCHEAEIFKRFVKLTITDSRKMNRLSTNDCDILGKYGIKYLDIKLLEEIGLIQDGSASVVNLGSNIYFIDDNTILDIVNDTETVGHFGVYNTTQVGSELARIVMGLDNSINFDYIKDFMKKINKDTGWKIQIGENYEVENESIGVYVTKAFIQ